MSRIGIEVETASIPGWVLDGGWRPPSFDQRAQLQPLLRYWTPHLDGSVEGPELVLKRPLVHGGAALGRALAALAEGLKGATFTPNCSTHIHVDCEGDSVLLLRTLLLSALMEETVFDYVGCPRTNTNFATPLRGEPQLEEVIRGLGLRPNSRGLAYLTNRYLWVNPLAFIKHGSVEFRLFDGTADTVQIRKWVDICAAIVRYAKRMGGMDHVRLLGPPATLVADVLPMLSQGVVVDEMALQTSLTRNFPLIYAILERLTAWESDREVPEKEPEVNPHPVTLRDLNPELNEQLNQIPLRGD